MKFDVIIGNPPYQLSTAGDSNGTQAKPIYNLFVEQAKKLKPRYLVMIIPSRWFAGGMGLDKFRDEMMHDSHITHLVDYANSKDCFPQNSISGGVCYFLRERDRSSKCEFININGKNRTTAIRALNEYQVLVRYNEAVAIIKKIGINADYNMSNLVSSISPFGLSTKERGIAHKDKKHVIQLWSSAGCGYISKDAITKGNEYLNSYKVMVSQTGAEHAGEPSKDGTFRVLTSTMMVLEPCSACTHSYLVVGPFADKATSDNVLGYLQTRFTRFLILQAMTSIHITKSTFCFVPIQDFSKPWTDEELYKKYNLSDDEIAFIESMIRPMDLNSDEND